MIVLVAREPPIQNVLEDVRKGKLRLRDSPTTDVIEQAFFLARFSRRGYDILFVAFVI